MNTRAPLTKRCGSCGYRYEETLAECPIDKVALPRPKVGGDYLGPYRLVERLAVGGMGSIYRAVFEKAGRSVAVKLLHRSLRDEVVSVSRFFTEARAVNTIRHPNVVEVYDLSGEGEDVFMVLELLRGRDLRTLLSEQPGGCLAPQRVVRILEQVCGALQATHARKIVHRDLKPENIYLTSRNGQDDFVKLLDFGVAKLERPEGRLTREGIALGTPEYMAPEQARGVEVDGRTDLYAVGCIAFEMLTGRTLFQGNSPGDIMVKQVREPPPAPRSLNPAVPPELEAVILSCLAKSPKARPQSAYELAQALCRSVGLSFDSTGAFMGWNGGEYWESPSAASLVSMPAVPVATLRRSRVGRAVSWFAAQRRSLAFVAVGALALVAGVGATLALDLFDRPTVEMRATAAQAAQPATDPLMAPEPPVEPVPVEVQILVESEPPGAALFNAEGTRVGVTPHRMVAQPGQTLNLEARRRGYLPAEKLVQVSEAPDGIPQTITFDLEPREAAKKSRAAKRRPRASARARAAQRRAR